MLTARKSLSMEDIDRQVALELPQRDTLLVTIVITNVLNNNTFEITVRDVDLALQLCAQIAASDSALECTQILE